MVEPTNPLVVPGRVESIRASHQRVGRRILVLDDDPTGSQAVHGVEAVLSLDPERDRRRLSRLRDLPVSCSRTAGDSPKPRRAGEQASWRWSPPRSNSASGARSRSSVGVTRRFAATSWQRSTPCHRHAANLPASSYDGVLLVPSYFEAGRFTASDIHWARIGDRVVAVGETEFARDLTFGYSSSDLRLFIEEKSGGAVRANDVHSISLDDIRSGGPERIEEILSGVHDGAFVVVNSVEYADLEVVVLGVLAAEDEGRRFLYRSGPSFVQVLAGIDPIAPLDAHGDLAERLPGWPRPGGRRITRRPHEPAARGSRSESGGSSCRDRRRCRRRPHACREHHRELRVRGSPGTARTPMSCS